MAVDSDAAETITFDSFTTLVDVHRSTREALEQHLDDPEAVAQVWRFRAVEYRMLCNFMHDVYETYVETTRHALEYALAVNGVDLPGETVEEIVSVFFDLHPFEDVRRSFERFAGEYDLYVASNGNPEVLDAMIEVCEIGDLIEDTISAHEIEIYKPDVEFYEHVCDRIDTPASRAIHVATPWYDVYGAKNAGMGAVWVNRLDGPWERFDGDPDLEVASLDELADTLVG